ncbi:MAG: O-antigen ligase family protein [Clostridia bacterium]|nr:O-antigen ligase family protein [Clostridia bacterium]
MDAVNKESPSVKERISPVFSGENLSRLMGAVFAFFVMLLHPVIFDDLFFNINRFKHAVYCYSAYFGLVSYMLLSYLKRKSLTGKIYEPFSLSLADWGMLAFSVIAAVSCSMSSDPASAFTGDEGRKSGLLFILAMLCVHIIVSRAPGAGKRAVQGLMISGFLVALLGTLNFFYIDPFGFYGPRLSKTSVPRFISTIGNIDFFAAFLCLYLPAVMVYCVKAKGLKSFLLFPAIATGAAAVVVSRADGAIIALLFSAFACMLFGVSSRLYLARALYSISAAMMGLFVVSMLIHAYPNGYMSLDESIQKYLVQYPAITGASSLALLCASYALTRSRKTVIRKKTARFLRRLMWFVLICAAFVFICLFIYYSFINSDSPLPDALEILRFSDTWGTHRGGVWVRSMKLYSESDLRVKLVGFGPDLLKKPLADSYGKEIIAYCNLSFDNAHNELIQYLLTLGALGLCSYLLFVVGGMHTLYRKMKQCPYAAAAFAAAAIYLTHSVVTVNQPITTPLLFLLLSAGVSSAKETDKPAAADGKEIACENTNPPKESVFQEP